MELIRTPRPAAIRGAAEWLLDDLDRWANLATSSVLQSIPSYRDHEDELARSVRFTMRTFLDYAISGVPPSEIDLARLRDVGRRRAEGRVPLADVLHAFRVSARSILAGLAQAPESLAADGVLWLAEALFAYIDVVSTQVTNRYAETQADLLRAQEVRRRDFLSDILHGHRSGADALGEAASLGIELLGEARVLVVGTPNPATNDLADDAEAQVEDLIAPTPVLAVRVGGDLVVLPLVTGRPGRRLGPARRRPGG